MLILSGYHVSSFFGDNGLTLMAKLCKIIKITFKKRQSYETYLVVRFVFIPRVKQVNRRAHNFVSDLLVKNHVCHAKIIRVSNLGIVVATESQELEL